MPWVSASKLASMEREIKALGYEVKAEKLRGDSERRRGHIRREQLRSLRRHVFAMQTTTTAATRALVNEATESYTDAEKKYDR